MTPARSRRWTRSATAGAERLTRRPSSANETRPSVVSSPMIRRSLSSSLGRSRPVLPESPLFITSIERSAFDSPCPVGAGSAKILRIAVDVTSTFPGRVSAVPPQAYFVGSAVFHYLGPSFAVLLFARVDVLGAVFAGMNACFYVSIDRLPLATVAAIEFVGPIALALIGARVGRNVAAVTAAAAGVYLLTRVEFAGEPVGIAFAFANAALFTAYIVLAHRVSRRTAMGGVDGLAAAMLFAFVFVSPIGFSGAAHALGDPTATATVIGVVVLSQLPSFVDLAGIALVMLGVALHRSEAAL